MRPERVGRARCRRDRRIGCVVRPAAAGRPCRCRSQPFGVHARGTRGGRADQLGPRAWRATVAARVSLVAHEGVHPRSGALDVVPFVALTGDPRWRRERRRNSRAGGRRRSRYPCSSTTAPTSNTGRCPRLVGTRSGARAPDLGPARPHPELGATAVGVRAPLVAINCLLDTADVEIARARRGWCANATAGSPVCAPSASSSPRPAARRSR